METRGKAEQQALLAAREYGIGTILFRNALAKRAGLSLTESLSLTVLGIRGASTPGELARFTGLTSGATTSMIDRLERRQFVRRRPNPDDRRGVIVEIDESSSSDARSLVSGIRRANQEVVAAYTERELLIIAEFLTKMTAGLTEESRKLDAGSQPF
ncbi:MAG: MarR family winged helix-turn-helix transcriptional regulator [Spirochaetota bacterium]